MEDGRDMSDLFPDLPVVLSPRLQWMQEHDVSVEQSLHEGQECELTGRSGPLWEAWYGDRPEGVNDSASFRMKGRLVLATTEEDAIIRLAERNGWPLWNM